MLAIAGPLDEQPDETLRGLFVYTVPPETTRPLASAGPAVRAGRLAAECSPG